MSEDYIGPVMPTGLTDRHESDTIGPVLPPHLQKGDDSAVIGPSLPPHLQRLNGNQEEDDSSNEGIGPKLPLHLRTAECSNSNRSAIGPVLPESSRTSNRRTSADSDNDADGGDSVNVIGPALPPGFVKPNDDDSEEDSYGPALPPGFQKPQSTDAAPESSVIGPLPSEMTTGSFSGASAGSDFEQRARKMKDKLTGKDEPGPTMRESWMTEIPTEMRKSFGLTARTFSTRVVPEADKDTSAWTDTPADKERKLREAEKRGRTDHDDRDCVSSSSKHKRDIEYEESVKKHKSKRGESLLERHEKERKKKKKKDKDKPKVRQPFDRDRDLQVNKFDDAQRKSIIKKSRELNTRFNHGGSTSSFL